MMKIRKKKKPHNAPASSDPGDCLRTNAEPRSELCFKPCLSPLAESFLVLMILAAYSWPVQSLTQRRTTEKAPLGGKKKKKKDRGREDEMGQQQCQSSHPDLYA